MKSIWQLLHIIICNQKVNIHYVYDGHTNFLVIKLLTAKMYITAEEITIKSFKLIGQFLCIFLN